MTRVPIPPKPELVLRYVAVWRRRRVGMPYDPDTRDGGSVICEDEFPSKAEAVSEAVRLLRHYPKARLVEVCRSFTRTGELTGALDELAPPWCV